MVSTLLRVLGRFTWTMPLRLEGQGLEQLDLAPTRQWLRAFFGQGRRHGGWVYPPCWALAMPLSHGAPAVAGTVRAAEHR